MVTIYRILYVDDEPGLLEIGKLFLERSGQFIVDIITSASDALKLLNSGNYDAIISDYQMPDMNGIEFLKNVRTSGNTIPFILFTGRGREEIVIEAINNGANFYLQKGGDPRSQFAEFDHKIRQAVQQRIAEDELRAAYEQITASEEELRAQFDEMVILQKQTDEYQQMLQQVLNTVPVRVFWKDLELHYLGCNEPFARDAGFSNPADLIGKTDFDMGWKEQADLYRADDRAVIETGIPKIGYEEPQTTTNGNRIWLRTSKIPLQAPGGNIIGILGTYEDITDRIIAHESLQTANTQITALAEELKSRLAAIEAGQHDLVENEVKYHAMVDAFDGLIYVCSQDYRIEFMNSNLIGRTGYDGTGMPCYKVLHELDMPCPWCVNDQVFAGEKVVWETESPKDHRWYHVVNTLIRHADGTLSKQAMITDITGRKTAERELVTKHENLQVAYTELAAGQQTLLKKQGDIPYRMR